MIEEKKYDAKEAIKLVRELYEKNGRFMNKPSPFSKISYPNNLAEIAKNIDRCPFCSTHHVELKMKYNVKFNGDRPSGLLFQFRCQACDGRSPECADLESAVISWEAIDPNVMGDIIKKEWSKNISEALLQFKESQEE